jgi:hypothetical protein
VIAYNELRRDVTCRSALLCSETRAQRTRLALAAIGNRVAQHPDPVVDALAAFVRAGAVPVALAPDQEEATVKRVANRSLFVKQEHPIRARERLCTKDAFCPLTNQGGHSHGQRRCVP